MPQEWTDEQIEYLRDLRHKQLTYTECANFFKERFGGHWTKNMMIGRANREKIKGNTSHDYYRPPKIKSPRKIPVHIIENGKKLIDLGKDDCRFSGEGGFCGEPVFEGKPYCEYHTSICYKKVSE